MVPGFRRVVNEVCCLVEFYVGYNVNSVQTFRDNPWDFLTLEDGTDRLSRNVGKELNHSTLRQIPEERRSQPVI